MQYPNNSLLTGQATSNGVTASSAPVAGRVHGVPRITARIFGWRASQRRIDPARHHIGSTRSSRRPPQFELLSRPVPGLAARPRDARTIAGDHEVQADGNFADWSRALT